MDFFCSIRYYKAYREKRTPLKFDYYMLRTVFAKTLLKFRFFMNMDQDTFLLKS